MKELLISSSALIAALLVLRVLFRKSVSRRVQYALWALVLVRLLVPVSLPGAEFSVLTAAEPASARVAARLEQQMLYVPVARGPLSEHPDAPDVAPEIAMAPSDTSMWLIETDEIAVQYRSLTTAALLRLVWCIGMAVMAVWFLLTNFLFYRKLRKGRIPYSTTDCKYPVYLCNGLPSPCLFGLFRPVIYVTAAAVETPAGLRHVLAHESTHARHWDPLWSLLRCVCLTVYWFHPLVWAAALASKTDCELACDEGALYRLDPQERLAYGQTLLRLIPLRQAPGNPLLSATSMTAGKRQLRDRITRIAENRQTVTAALFAVIALAAVVCAVTFTDGKAVPEGGASSAAFLPDAQPDAVVSLESLTPVRLSVTTGTPAAAQSLEIMTEPVAIGDFEVFAYRDSDGASYLAYRPAAGDDSNVHWFQMLDDSEVGAIEPIDDLLGYDGFSVRLLLPDGTLDQPACYCFDSSGDLLPLASSTDWYTVTDFDCDGSSELLFSYSSVYGTALLLRRDDGLYAADLEALAQQAYPGSDPFASFGTYDAQSHSLPLTRYLSSDDSEWRTAFRWMFFDGAQLLFYKDWRTMSGHVLGSTTDIPDEVLAAAKSQVMTYYGEALSGDFLSPAALDDWRIERLTYVHTYPDFHGMEIEVYRMNYEFHATAPEKVMLAGGMYLTEDGWVMPSYPDCQYLFFSVENGQRTYLYDAMFNDCGVDSPLFLSDMEHYFFQHPGLLPSFEGYAEPVEHSEEDYQAAMAQLRQELERQAAHPNVSSLDIHDIFINEAETARVVRMYTGGPLAERQQLSDDVLRQMIAVEAVYTLRYIPAVQADSEGLMAKNFYLLPEKNSPGSWYVWDSMGCAVPPEYPAEPVL